MADQDSRSPFWTSLPGILTGAAALITAISGLAIWHSKSNPQPAPTPAPLVQQQQQPQPLTQQPQVVPATTPVAGPAVPIGSEQWCEEKYTAWKSDKTQTGVDNASLRKEITQAHCNQFGIKLGKVKEQP